MKNEIRTINFENEFPNKYFLIPPPYNTELGSKYSKNILNRYSGHISNFNDKSEQQEIQKIDKYEFLYKWQLKNNNNSQTVIYQMY